MRPAELLLQSTMRRQITRSTYGQRENHVRPCSALDSPLAHSAKPNRCQPSHPSPHLTTDAGAVEVVHHAERITALGKVEEDGPDIGPRVDQKETQSLLRGVAATAAQVTVSERLHKKRSKSPTGMGIMCVKDQE